MEPVHHGTDPSRQPNRLVNEKSPYLLQHAHNPVDWYPWGDEAFERADREEKPVFLSIGYATCHWCHVMARESFENPEIASILNRDFICIKVDREERPDIDSIYMTACQLMTGGGGWPLSVFLAPDKKPFYAGTYFPPKGRFGMPGFPDILQRIAQLWKAERGQLVTASDGVLAAVASASAGPEEGRADFGLIRRGYEALAASFDPEHGGFGRAPKFPSPPLLLFLLRYHKRTGEEPALAMVTKTLEAMCHGGIRDHLGGGFHRYSVDDRWEIPHFEKMLYDQALLLQVYTEAAICTGKPLFRKTADEIAAYILGSLKSPEGAFISAEDADSPGGEGAFYLLTPDEISAVLGSRDAEAALRVFRLVPFSDPHAARPVPGTGVLARAPGPEEIAPSADPAAGSIRSRLLEARNARPHPSRDTKILADTNALCIASLAGAFRAFGDMRYLSAAQEAMSFILARMRMPDGGLFHRYRDGEAAIFGFADDYAFVVRALLELYRSDFNPAWLAEAVRLEQYQSVHFRENTGGAYYTTSDNAEPLPVRRMEFYDGVVPSANSVALGNLALLALATGSPEYEERAALLARTCAGAAERAPAAGAWFLAELDLLINPSSVVTIDWIQPGGAPDSIVRELWQQYLPAVLLLPGNPGDGKEPGAVSARVCTGRRCSLPVHSVPEILAFLAQKNS